MEKLETEEVVAIIVIVSMMMLLFWGLFRGDDKKWVSCNKDYGVVTEKNFQPAYSGGWGGSSSGWKFVYSTDSGKTFEDKRVFEIGERIFKHDYCEL